MKFAGEAVAWQSANIALLIWSAIGVCLAVLWVCRLLKVKNTKKLLFLILLFLGFSGLDFIGTILQSAYSSFEARHLEWWATFFQYSSMITQLFWVFNQCIIPWIITIMLINEKRVRNFLLLVLICFTYAPFPFVGLALLMGIKGIKLLIQAIKSKEVARFFLDIYSLENILGFIAIFPIYFLFYQNNSAVGVGIRLVSEVLNRSGMIRLLEFYFVEVGIYIILTIKENRKNELFIGSAILLMFIPLIAMGLEYDFCMRVSIPAIVIINFYFAKYIIDEFEKEKINTLIQFFKMKKINFRLTVAIVVFCIGLLTPFVEVTRGVYFVVENKKIDLVADNIKTLSDKDSKDYVNFLSVNPEENSVFYKYIAK